MNHKNIQWICRLIILGSIIRIILPDSLMWEYQNLGNTISAFGVIVCILTVYYQYDLYVTGLKSEVSKVIDMAKYFLYASEHNHDHWANRFDDFFNCYNNCSERARLIVSNRLDIILDEILNLKSLNETAALYKYFDGKYSEFKLVSEYQQLKQSIESNPGEIVDEKEIKLALLKFDMLDKDEMNELTTFVYNWKKSIRSMNYLLYDDSFKIKSSFMFFIQNVLLMRW